MNKLKVHGSIVRVINRNTSCAFLTIPFTWNLANATIPSIIYNCRTSASWDGDMALSVTFFPETLTTNAVWYGCDLSKRKFHGDLITDSELICGQLENFDGDVLHPMILPVVFAGFERERHIGTVRKCLTQFVQRIHDLASPELQALDKDEGSSGNKEIKSGYGLPLTKEGCLAPYFRLVSRLIHSKAAKTVPPPKTNSHQKEEEQEPAVLLWQKQNISFLRIGLQNWQTQLGKMIDHIHQLKDIDHDFKLTERDPKNKRRSLCLRQVGDRLETRIQDLVEEYDEYIRQCTHIMDGLTLATQLELNNIGRKGARTNQKISRVSLEVAQMTRLDGSLMKSIAMLGMVFLPATFVSTFFSMGFFQWTGEDGERSEILSPYFWIYVVVAVGLTIFTMSIFYICTLRATLSIVEGIEKHSQHVDMDSQDIDMDSEGIEKCSQDIDPDSQDFDMDSGGVDMDTEIIDDMIQQFLSLEYGNKRRLKEKLDDYFGSDTYEIVERSGNQWQIMVPRKLEQVCDSDFFAMISELNTNGAMHASQTEIEEIEEHMKQHYKSTT
ncbi:hypothetical protein FANTH_1755 [Fusarium anthophilum]|uniref:Uncharacterized protein n=1 Tax=Fusarium anthophilum TaxID=48485 RepID=A0A8H4ZV41_9HYPO|nr:hypothetical protein FANTH_1755 [Fusarium anthophilum]